MNLKGFTLAETFCTMVIISVLSLLFFQNVYFNYTRRVAATKIQRFHTIIKQIQLKAQKDYSDWIDYYLKPETITEERFMNEYILPYVTYLKKDVDADGNVHVFLSDSTSFSIKKTSCMTFIYDINGDNPPNIPGKDIFYFNYCPATDSSFIRQGDFIPYLTKSMSNKEAALGMCRETPMSCSGYISFYNFEFPEEYPYRIPL